jgi:hypothetical protein
MKNTTVRPFLDCLSGDVMMKSVHKYCNTLKCSAEMNAKKVFRRTAKRKKNKKCDETDRHVNLNHMCLGTCSYTSQCTMRKRKKDRKWERDRGKETTRDRETGRDG